MMFAASKEYIRKKLDGIFTEIQCTDLSETAHDVVLDKVLRMTQVYLNEKKNNSTLKFYY